MLSAFLEPVDPPPLDSLPRKKWTRYEIDELVSKGWYPGDGYELIHGELIDKKVGKNLPHLLVGKWIQQWLVGIFGLLQVHTESPIVLAAENGERNEPEPDLVVLRAPLHELGKNRSLPMSCW